MSIWSLTKKAYLSAITVTNISPSIYLQGTHTHPFNGPFSGTTHVSRHQKGKTNLDFTEARDSEWQWHQLGHMQVCTSLQTDNHASTSPLSFLQARCPSCRPTNSVKALKGQTYLNSNLYSNINYFYEKILQPIIKSSTVNPKISANLKYFKSRSQNLKLFNVLLTAVCKTVKNSCLLWSP